jgi:hypothetical protein
LRLPVCMPWRHWPSNISVNRSMYRMGLRKTFRCQLEKWGNAHCIPVSAAIGQAFIQQGHRRVFCTIDGLPPTHAALLTRKALGDYYIYVGKALLKTLQPFHNKAFSITLAADDSPYQFDMPEELAEVLATDPEAHQCFHALTPGRQRGLMHLVSMVKSVDKKIERALRIAEKIKAGITSPAAVLK